jgi:WD40 repeat protein
MADGSIRLFDIETGTETERFQEHDREKRLTILSIAASGDLIATATVEDKAGPVIVRDLRSATAPVCLLAGERHEITCVAFSEDGSIVACATREGECFAFETATGRQMFRADPGIGCPAEAIVFDGHHNQMTVVGETGLVRCYDATTGEPLLNHTMVLRNQEVGLDASIIVGSERKVIAAEYAVIQIFNVKTLRQQVLKDLDHKALLPMAISPDGSLLATASTDGAVRIWRIQDGLRTSILRGHRARVSALHFFPDGTRLASSDKAGTICIWNIADAYLKGKELTQWLRARVPLGVLTLKRRDDENLLLRDVLDKGEPGTRDLVAALDRFSSISE